MAGRAGVAGEVVEELQERIRSHAYGPGERLPAERALSEELGVSRPTVREAIQALVSMNVLEARRGSGIYVAPLDFGDLLRPLRFALELIEPALSSLFEVRLALEPLASSLAATRRSDDQLASMRRCMARAAAEDVSARHFVDLDTELHALIVEASGNELLVNLISSLSFLSHRSRSFTVREASMQTASARDHQAIVTAIAAGDAQRADTAMRHHLERAWRTAQRMRREDGATRSQASER
jgi:GntR family transcriptional repressor for pyruvate dehydrogenase complex